MSVLKDEQVQLACLLQIVEENMRDLLRYFVKDKVLKKNKQSITTSSNPKIALAEILESRTKHILEQMRKHIIMKNYSDTIFEKVNDSYEVKKEIDLEIFDLSALNYLLTMNVPLFPTRRAEYRKRDSYLQCLYNTHQDKCCGQCKHLRTDDGYLECTSCGISHHSCYNERTPCCNNCKRCYSCGNKSSNVCPNMTLRDAITYLGKVRNLKAHITNSVYEELINGIFDDNDFDTCKCWNDLWYESVNHTTILLKYLERNRIIDKTKRLHIENQIKNELHKWSVNDISRFYPKTFLNCYQQVCDLTQAVADLNANLTSTKEALKQLPVVSFDLQFALIENNDRSCVSVIYEFLGCEPIKRLPKEELKIQSNLSDNLIICIENNLKKYLGEDNKLTIALNAVVPDIEVIDSPHYKFTIECADGEPIPICYKMPSSQESKELWKYFQTFLHDVVLKETQVNVDVELRYWRLGSLTLIISLSERSYPHQGVHLPTHIELDFNFKGMKILNVENVLYQCSNSIQYSFDIYNVDHTLYGRIQDSIKEMKATIIDLEKSARTDHYYRVQMAVSTGVIPLCYPNNFSWDESMNQLVPIWGQQRKTLEILPEALESIANIKDAIAVISICGPARSGKSYMLSQLQDGVEFELGHTLTSQTTGIWMSREPTFLTTRDGKRLRLILLDTEGIGAASALDDQHNETWDNQIFILSTLISSTLIYNSQGVPNANDLEKLDFIANLSESVYPQMKDEDSSSLATFRNYSPDFFWLVRDLYLQPTDRNGQKCDIKTYLYDNVLRSEDESDSSDIKSRRNAIRQNIREMFPTFDAYGLPMPSLDPEVIQNMSDPRYRSEINPKFTSELREVRNRILSIVEPKRMAGAAFITGSTLVELIKMYVKALNEKGCVPEWSTAWESAVKITGERALQAAINEYRKCTESVLRQLPCDTDYILSFHNDSIKRACDLFSEETRMITDGMTAEYISRLMAACAEFDEVILVCVGGILMEIMSKNAQASEKFCEELCIQLQQEHIDPLLENITADTTFESLLIAVDFVNEEYEARAIGPCRSSVQNRYARAFNQRLKEAAKDISKMKDYDVKLNNEMQEQVQNQAAMELIDQQNQVLSENMKMAGEQHKQQLNMMQEQQKRAEEEMNRLTVAQREDKERLMDLMTDVKDEHSSTVNALVSAQEQQVRTLSEQHDQNKRTMLEQQQRLREMMEQQQEQHRIQMQSPGKKGKESGRCVIS